MRVDEAVGYMSKAFLHRVIDSFTKDIHKPETEESRELIVRNVKELADRQHIATKLERSDSFDTQVLTKMLLFELLAAEDHRLTEGDLIEQTQQREQQIIEQGNSEDSFKYKDRAKVETYRTVLEVALEDDHITPDELNLLTRLRKHLGLREQDHFLIQAKLGNFPTREGRPHSASQINSCLTDLQKRGVVFFCNRAEKEPFYVIPEEIEPGIKKNLGIELSRAAHALLLDHLSQPQLKTLLEAFKLPTSGKKEVQAARLLDAGIQPSEALSELGLNELQALCKSLPGVKSSGSKGEKIENIIAHFAKLRTVDVDPGADPRELYFEYYVELARRDRENLLTNKVIAKDKDMDSRGVEEPCEAGGPIRPAGTELHRRPRPPGAEATDAPLSRLVDDRDAQRPGGVV